MPLQLNSNLTKALAVNFARLNQSARLVFVSDAVPIPTSLTSASFKTYLDSFMLTANQDNYLGSVVVAGYQNFNNSIVYGSATGTALRSGRIGSVVCMHSSNTGAPGANTTSSAYEYANAYTFFITDSISIIDDPKMCVVGSLDTVAGQSISHLSTTISMVSAF